MIWGLVNILLSPLIRLFPTISIYELLLNLFVGWLLPFWHSLIIVDRTQSSLGFSRPVVIIHWTLGSNTLMLCAGCYDKFWWVYLLRWNVRHIFVLVGFWIFIRIATVAKNYFIHSILLFTLLLHRWSLVFSFIVHLPINCLTLKSIPLFSWNKFSW